MKLNVVFLFALVLALCVGCEKDKFTTIPQIKVKSIDPSTVNQGDIITMETEFTDEEGDIDSIYLVWKWYDGNTVTKLGDTLDYSFDSYGLPPKTRDGDIFVKFAYGRLDLGYPALTPAPTLRDTTATLGIVLIDKKKNRSEYKESDKIRLKKL